MGLFNKKKDEAPTSQSPAATGASQAGPPSDAAPAQEPAQAAPAGAAPAYGIADAIELMRTLPAENVKLVIQVVKRTLESVHVRIDSIIADAAKKQAEIEERINVLRGEIVELDSEIALRKEEIETLEADYKETTLVKERLMMAEKLTTGAVPPSARTPQQEIEPDFMEEPPPPPKQPEPRPQPPAAQPRLSGSMPVVSSAQAPGGHGPSSPPRPYGPSTPFKK